jgi:hypothetical protein
MKTSKAKTVTKPKKTSEAGVPVKRKKVSVSKSLPGEEEIREKAKEIYNERIARGEHGSPESDWLEAEKLLRGPKKK